MERFMIVRSRYLNEISELFETFPVVAILGPRQCGKSTLAKQYTNKAHTFDLESDKDLNRLQEAELSLEDLEGLIVIDEIQRRPELFPVIRYLVDKKPQKYLILGSASRDLINQSSETLAGRIAYVELPPLGLLEVGNFSDSLWRRGGFPRSLLSSSETASYRWRIEYIRTFLERDLFFMGFGMNPKQVGQLWTMLAHYHGQLLNISTLGQSLGISTPTIQRYLDMLEGTFMIKRLQPWHANLMKRQIRTPKVYIRDTGLLHALLNLKSHEYIEGHPQLGFSFEGFAISEIIKALQPDETYFWRTSHQAELDLLILKEGKKQGFEFKYSYSPKITKSMHIAKEDLGLTELTIIIPKGEPYRLSQDVHVCGLKEWLLNFS